MKKHYVRFYSPGTFSAEESVQQVPSWDVEAARALALTITGRHGAIPYGFSFYTMEREGEDWEPHRSAQSPMYYLPHCKVETLEELDARNDPGERILRANMRTNGWGRVVRTTRGWPWSQPLNDTDVVLT